MRARGGAGTGWRGLCRLALPLLLAVPLDTAGAHELGFGNLEVRSIPGESPALEGELTLDAPQRLQDLDVVQRHAAVLNRVRTGLRLEQGGQTLEVRLSVVSLGHGSQGVDVVRLLAMVRSPDSEITFSVVKDLGALALYVTPHGAGSPHRALLRPGVAKAFPFAAIQPATAPTLAATTALVSPPSGPRGESLEEAPSEIDSGWGLGLRIWAAIASAILAGLWGIRWTQRRARRSNASGADSK